MTTNNTAKKKSAFAMLTVLGLRQAHIEMLINSPENHAAYTYLRNQGYRWSSDLQRWVPIKRGINAANLKTTRRYQYVNVYADVAPHQVNDFVETWRQLADLADYAVAADVETKGHETSKLVRVYLRFRKEV